MKYIAVASSLECLLTTDNLTSGFKFTVYLYQKAAGVKVSG